MTMWKDTPNTQGSLPVAVADAKVAATHAGFVQKSSDNLDSMKLHAGHILHALNPTLEPKGPGSGYGPALGLSSALGCLGSPGTGENQMTTGTQFPVQKTDDQWRDTLSPEQYRVLREHGKERAFTSPLNHEKRQGTFVCAGDPACMMQPEVLIEFALRVCICTRVLMKSGLPWRWAQCPQWGCWSA